MCGLWSPGFRDRPLVGFVDVWPCGAYMVWVGAFSLCGCEMISGLLPRICPTILSIVSL